MQKMQESACTQMLACHLMDGAGHWVQQEQSDKVAGLILEFYAAEAYRCNYQRTPRE